MKTEEIIYSLLIDTALHITEGKNNNPEADLPSYLVGYFFLIVMRNDQLNIQCRTPTPH